MKRYIKSASYGGAFDIEYDQYFTRDDLVDFGDVVCHQLEKKYPGHKFDIYDTYIDNNVLYLEVVDENTESQASYSKKLDMRRIRRPQDLIKNYVEWFVMHLADDMYLAFGIDEDESVEKLG